MLSLLSLLFIAPATYAETRFETVARALMDTSDQSIMISQDRRRTELDYDVAIGNLYDPTLRASFWDQYKGDYINRRLDVSLHQRTSLWGLSVMGGYRLGNGGFPTYDGKFQTQDSGEVRFGFELPLLRNGYTDSFRTALRKGEISRSLSQQQESVQRLDLMRLLGTRYWDWFVSAHRYRISKELLELATTRQEKIKIRVSRGDIAKIEELEGDRTILQRKAQLAQTERSFTKSRLDLEAFLSQKGAETSVRLDLESLPAVEDFNSLNLNLTGETPDLEHHPEIERQNSLLEQARLDARLAENQFLPKLDLALNLSQDLGNPNYVLSKPRNEAGVLFEFPIPSRSASARTSQMRAMTIKQDAQISLSRRRVENSVIDAQVALRLAGDRARISNEELDLAKKLVDMENKRFLNGDSNLLLLNLREQNYAEAELRKVEAFSDLKRSRNELNVASGRIEVML
jgi:outer membrane protein TolC